MQLLFTIGASAAAAYLATENLNKSLFLGFLVALSSTAIVLKILAERGRIMVGILIFQDLCVIPLMLLTPALSGEGMVFLCQKC